MKTFVFNLRAIARFPGGRLLPSLLLMTITFQGMAQSIGWTDNFTRDVTPSAAQCDMTGPSEIFADTDGGLCTALIAIVTPVSDNCSVTETPIGVRSDGLLLTDPFPVGTTVLTWTVNDANGNGGTLTQSVVVTDPFNPTIATPEDVDINNTSGECFGSVTLTPPTATDNCGTPTMTSDHPGTQFPVGETIVTWTATDGSGNKATTTQKVTVTDTENPSLGTVEPFVTRNDPGSCSATLIFNPPTATDNCGIDYVTADFAGNTFPIGETLINWIAFDIHGNMTIQSQSVVVTDEDLPQIVSPADTLVNTDSGLCSAQVVLTPPVATDNCEVASIVHDQTDNIFAAGETIVTWTVTDIHGNISTVTQKVIVSDVEAPVIADTDINVFTDSGLCSATVDVTALGVTDNCGISSVTHNQTSNVFPLGETIVTWTVTDIHGNITTALQKITVSDNQPPVINAPDDIIDITDMNLCSATVELTPPTATDICSIASVQHDQPDNIFPVGETIVTWTATDIHGNTSTVTQIITVSDGQDPVIAVAPDITVGNSAGSCSATVTLTPPTASDNCGVASVSHDQADNIFPVGETTVTWTATDIHGHTAITTQKVIVTNAAPVIGSVSLSATSVPINSPVTLTATFTDNNATTVTINWGDQSQTINNPSGTITISHTYTTAGTYGITVTITDACGLQDVDGSQIVSVTSAQSEGLVIGAGWFDSAPGSHSSSKSKKKDKGTFAFIAKSGRRQPDPIGDALFKLHTGNLLFVSTDYHSLLIDEHKATFKGKGKVNGVPGYNFLISVVDGDIISRRTPDKFRIKIWNSVGTVLYDNQRGAPDDAQATTPIEGGEIIIFENDGQHGHHNNVTTTRESDTYQRSAEETSVSAWPNPFTDVFTFKFDTRVKAPLQVQLIDVTGVPVYDKVHEYSEDGTYHVLLNNAHARSGVYFLRVNQGRRVEYLKMLRN